MFWYILEVEMSGGIEKPSQLSLNPGWSVFISLSVAKVALARRLSLTAQAMPPNGLALGPLNFVTLQAFRVLFASILFLSGFACSLALSLHLSMLYIHTSSSNPSQLRQPNLAPKEQVQMLHPEAA